MRILGLALGVVIRRATVLLLVVLAGGIAVRYGVQYVESGSSGDNDPRVILVVALVANLIGFLVGAVRATPDQISCIRIVSPLAAMASN